jgi:hypothetical protein
VSPSKSRRVLLVATTSLVAFAASAAPTYADELVDSAMPCADQTLERPFAPWLDPASYTLAPDGTMENGAPSWSFDGGAGLTDGNEPYFVHAPGESTSLALPSGSRATSGAMCVGVEHPTMRFFAKRTGGSALGVLRVDVLYHDAAGTTRSLPVGAVTGNGSWAPSAPVPVVANVLSLLSGGTTTIAFRFVPVASSWSIDDVYVDPFMRR